MDYIFYSIGLIFLIYEIFFLFNLREEVRKKREFSETMKKYKGVPWSDLPELVKNKIISKSFFFIFLLWLFLGLLSSQWVLFFILLTTEFLILVPLVKLLKETILYIVLITIDTLVCIFFITLIILNKYHLHIDFYKEFFS